MKRYHSVKKYRIRFTVCIALLTALLTACGSETTQTDANPGEDTQSLTEPSEDPAEQEANTPVIHRPNTDASSPDNQIPDTGSSSTDPQVVENIPYTDNLTEEDRAALLTSLGLDLQEVTVEVPQMAEHREIIFLADTHVSLCDDRDPALMDKASARYEEFRDANGRGADDTFRAWMEYVKAEDPDLLILGGDIIDSAMYASLDFLEEQLSDLPCPYLYLMGNHDFEYGSEYYSEAAFRDYLPRLSAVSKTQEGYQILDCGDYYVFAIDDYCNRYSQQAYEAFEYIRDAGKPVLAVTHVPIEPLTDDTSLLETTIAAWGADAYGRSRVLLGRDGIPMDDSTVNLINSLLGDNTPVVHVLAGHAHLYHRDVLELSIEQTITAAGYEDGGVRLILE